MTKSILFRVDAGGETGLGHFYRSVNLASHLKNVGYSVTFIYKSSKFWGDIVQNEFPFHTISLTKETNEYTVLLSQRIKLLYVDGFIDYSEKDIAEIKKLGVKIIFYQNLTDSRKYADIFILPSIHQKEAFFKAFSAETKIYKGLKYFTFNENIHLLKPKQLPTELKKVAVIAGGSDPSNCLKQIYKLVKSSGLEDVMNFTFYYGANYMHHDSIPKKTGKSIKWALYNAEQIVSNDLLISAFGVSTYEFLAVGMPIVAFGHQKQNANSADYLAQHTHSMMSLGLIDELDVSFLKEKIMEIRNKPESLNTMLKNAKRIIDLKGVQRVKDIIIGLE